MSADPRAAELLRPERLQAAFDAHGLGRVMTIQPAQRGLNNLATVVNDAYVIRFDLLDLDDRVCRYHGERTAYAALRAAGLPGPDVVALDLSKSLLPVHYLILTRVPGEPLIDLWPTLSAADQARLARSAGETLARMHQIALPDGLGRLDIDLLPRWFDFVERFFDDYAPSLAARGLIEAKLYARLRAIIAQLRPLVDFPQGQGRLVHGDYQFENLLVHEGQISAVIDFEWGKCGDPAWDFKLEEQWDADCPGSAVPILAGYAAVRSIPEATRIWLYKLLFHLDNLDFYADAPDNPHGNAGRWAYSRRELLRALAALEAETG
jgi:aminoglycoside phosphotransferase (APT) family kinase protein